MSLALANLSLAINRTALETGWVHLIPQGPAVVGGDGRTWSMENPEEVVNRFRAANRQRPVDFEHATELKGAKGEFAPAIGWVEEIEAREDGIWGRVEWLEEGRNAVESKAYKYLSPVFTFHPTSKRIHELVSVGLTNKPNLPLTALNRADDTPPQETQMEKAILEALGLSGDATTADAVVAINRMKEERATALNRAETPDAEKFVPRADYQLALNRIEDFKKADAERENAEIETVVGEAIEAGKIAPCSKDYHIASCRAEGGLERFRAMVDAAPELAAPAKDRKDPEQTKLKTALNTEQDYARRQLGLSVEDYKAAMAAEGENA